MFVSFKKYFGWRPPKIEHKSIVDDNIVIPELGVDVDVPSKNTILLRSDTPSEAYIDNILNKQKNDVKYINNTERGFMSEKFLVILDTTGRPEVKDRGLKGGLKNFYFILANDEAQARQMVLSTFSRAPSIMAQIQNSIRVIPLDKIAPHVNEKAVVWSYIPLRKESK